MGSHSVFSYLQLYLLFLSASTSHSLDSLPRRSPWIPAFPSFKGLRLAEERKEDFLLPKPKEVVKNEGGSVYSWFEEDFKHLKDAGAAAAIVEIEAKSLKIPMYSDVNELLYVTHGCAYAGLISPLGISPSVRYLSKGDLFLVPRGWVRWVWNDGNEPWRAFTVIDRRNTPPLSGEETYTAFDLAGKKGEHYGSTLQGFSSELLAEAWGVSKDDVKTFLNSQDSVEFVKVKKRGLKEEAHALSFMGKSLSEERREEVLSLFSSYKFGLASSEPDLSAKRGGFIQSVTSAKWGALRGMHMAAARVKLEAGAMLAPHWIASAASFVHVVKGKGRVEIVYPDGKNALRADVKKGDTIIIPAGFPTIQRASDDQDFEWLGVFTNERAFPTFLAGANSVFKGAPEEVLQAAFNVDKSFEDKFYKARSGTHDLVIFPPKKKPSVQ